MLYQVLSPRLNQVIALAYIKRGNTHILLENIDEAKTKAVADAYRRARASAQALATAAGRVLGELSYASVDTSENIRIYAPMQRKGGPMVAMEAVAPTAEFTPQEVTVTSHVNAMFMMK